MLTPGIDPYNFSAKWTGYLKPLVSGKYVLDMTGYTSYRLLLNDSTVIEYPGNRIPRHREKSVSLTANKLYKIEIQYTSSDYIPMVKLSWQIPDINYEKEAMDAAQKADAIVMVMGLSPRLEGEEMNIKIDGFARGDRTKLQLPAVQQKRIKKVAALGKPVVLVLVNGSALAVNWEKENLPAIVEAWYGGQEAGTALADVLFGDYNPSGRLPVTFYSSENDLPAFDNYDMKGRTYRYFKGEPLYEFGYGLSFTQLTYANLKVNNSYKTGSNITITAQIQNTGDFMVMRWYNSI